VHHAVCTKASANASVHLSFAKRPPPAPSREAVQARPGLRDEEFPGESPEEFQRRLEVTKSLAAHLGRVLSAAPRLRVHT
jgi:hypothetical protein